MPFYITPQTPLQVNETKKKLQKMNTKYREENVKTKIIGNKLVFPNGNVYRNRVQPPRAEGILTMDEEEIERQEVTMVVKGEELTQKGNTSKSLSSTIKTYAHIRNMYKKCSLTQNLPVQIITFWRTDSRIRRAAFTMGIATMVNTGPVDGC